MSIISTILCRVFREKFRQDTWFKLFANIFLVFFTLTVFSSVTRIAFTLSTFTIPQKYIIILDFLNFKLPKQTYSCHLGSRYSLCWCLVEEMLMYNSEHTAKFEISLPVTLCLPFLRFLVTGSQLSQHFAVRNSVVFLAKTKTNA